MTYKQGSIHMDIVTKDKATYDLTIEYMRQNNKMKISPEISLKTRIKEFKEVYYKIRKYLD